MDCIFWLLATVAALVGGVYYMVYAPGTKKAFGLVPLLLLGIGFVLPVGAAAVGVRPQDTTVLGIVVGLCVFSGGVLGVRLYAQGRVQMMIRAAEHDDDSH